MRRAAALLAVLALAGCHKPAHPPKTEQASVRTEQVTLKASDGVEVFGTYSSPEKPRGIILLFHQAGSGQGEYLTIAPRLNAAGFATLAIDQRSGGDLFGGNWTVKKLGASGTYLDARKDMEAALGWAEAKKLPVVLWGSSYSASLAFLVAADHPEVKALLAFSPGEYFDGKPAVLPAAGRLAMPLFVTSAQDAGEEAAAKTLIDAAPAANKRQFVPVKGGVHGSSTLIVARNSGAEDVWSAVLAFLDRAVSRPN